MVRAMPSALDWLDAELAELEADGLTRFLRRLNGTQGRVIDLDGQPVLNFSSNNYLGLADNDEVRRALAKAVSRAGAGAGASRLIAGNMAEHEELEVELARFHGTEAALVFNSGYHANLGVLQALAGPDDEVFSDALNHASLIDGCRLCRARVTVYRHGDLTALADGLVRSRSQRKLVVTDALFSMDGDVAPAAELADLCARSGAMLVVDEAHAVGAFGPGGRGVCAQAGIQPAALVGTMGKAFGVFGAYVAGERRLIRHLVNRARSFIFTTALPPSIMAACRASLRIISSPEGDRRRSNLADRATQLHAGLAKMGIDTHSRTHVQPVIIGDASLTMSVAQELLGRGLYAQGIRPPTVPRGESRLRVALMATHTDGDLGALLAGLVQALG
jgi:8-amino-7-oxononanoate synthase